MFFVLNKEKIYSYIIAVLTVIVLFAVSEVYVKDDEYVETSANYINENNNNTSNNINQNVVNMATNKLEGNKEINKK